MRLETDDTDLPDRPMNARTKLLITLFFAGLVGLWWADRAGVPTSAQLRQRSGRVLPELIDVPVDWITRIEIYGGPQSLVLDRSADGWEIVRPLATEADAPRVEGLLAALKALPRRADVGTLRGRDEQFGLKPPSRSVRLYQEGKSEPIATLDLGGAAGEGRYVRPAGQKEVDVADAKALAALDGSVADWREARLFPEPSFDVSSVEMTGPSGPLAIRRERGHARLVRPFRAPADEVKVEGLIAGLGSLGVADGAGGFVADALPDKAKYGFDRPSRTIRVETGRGRDRTVEIGAAVPDRPGRFYARRGGRDEVLVVDDAVLAPLDVEPHSLRSKSVADMDPSAIETIRVRSGEVDRTLRRGPSGWQVLDGKVVVGEADREAVSRLLNQLATAQAAEIRVATEIPAESGLETPTMVVEAREHAADAKGGSGRPPVVLEFGRRDRGKKSLWARLEGDPTILLLLDTAFDFNAADPFAFLDRTLRRGRPGTMTDLKVTRDGETVHLVRETLPGAPPTWRMVAPVAAPIDRDTVTAIEILLSGMRAETIVGRLPEGDHGHGLDRPFLDLTWVEPTRGSESPGALRLTVGEELPGARGGRVARLSGFPFLFTLGSRSLSILGGELRDRLVVTLKPDRVASVLMKRGGKSQAFEHPITSSGPRWQAGSDQDASPEDFGRIEAAMIAMASIRAVQFTQYRGPISRGTGLIDPALALEIHSRDSPEIVRLRLGHVRPDGLRYATLEPGDSGAVFLLPQTQAEPWAGLIGKAETGELPADPFQKSR